MARPPKAQDLKQAKKTTGGNNKPDVAWIAEVTAAGELHPPDESQRPPGFLYDIHYQWEGSQDEVNIEFFESFRVFTTTPCNGTAYIRDESGMYIVDRDWQRLTRPCLRRPRSGTVVCASHGGNIPAVKAAAERVLADAAEVVAIRLVGLTATKDELEEIIEHKTRLAAMNSVLDRAGIKGGVSVEVELPGYKKVLENLFGTDEGDDEQPAA